MKRALRYYGIKYALCDCVYVFEKMFKNPIISNQQRSRKIVKYENIETFCDKEKKKNKNEKGTTDGMNEHKREKIKNGKNEHDNNSNAIN